MIKRFSAIIAVLAVSVLLMIFVSGCNSSKKEATATMPQQAQPGAAIPAPAVPQAQAPLPAPAPAPAGNALSGKVVETMNSGGYTYVLIENNGKKTWVAGPQTTVKVGQQVSCEPGMEMKNFTSKTLKRTFESIVFSGGIR